MHTKTRLVAGSTAILGLLAVVATGCRGLPEEGDFRTPFMSDTCPNQPMSRRLWAFLFSVAVALWGVALASCGGGDCSDASAVGNWMQVSASHPTRDSWSLSRMTLRSDCSMSEVEFEGARRSDTGRFSQSGDRLSMDFVEWNDRSAVLVSPDTMVMETASGWSVTAVRDGVGPGTPEQDAGAGGGGDCHLEVTCNANITCHYWDSCLLERARLTSVNLTFAEVLNCNISRQDCVCARMGPYDFDEVRNIPDADAWALANCGWIPGVYNGVAEFPPAPEP